MKTFSEKTVVTEELTDVRCNRCGRAVEKDGFGYFDDYVSFQKTWGYRSPIDGETHEFDVCIDCYRQWIGQFAIPPRITTSGVYEVSDGSTEPA